MKQIKLLIMTIIFVFIPIFIYADGIMIDNNSITINEGESASFTITPENVIGRLDITITNDNVSLSSESSAFEKLSTEERKWKINIENNNAIVVNVNALNKGETIINISTNLDDAILNGNTDGNIIVDEQINVTVNHVKSDNANLADIKIDNVGLEGFSSDKVTYDIITDNSSVVISATVDDENANVLGYGLQDLNYGLNKIYLDVTAEDEIHTKRYTLNITRNDNRDSNTYLESLTVSVGSLDFDKNITEYNIIVDDDVESIIITAEPESNKATVSGDGPKSLSDNNVFEIIVTAENESTKKYTISVKKNDQVIITYNSNGGVICNPSSKTVTKGSSIGDLCIPTRNKYKFNGWYTESSGGEKVTSTTKVDHDFTIYAQWSKVATTNPKTGIEKPILALLIIAVISSVAFIIIKKRKISFD